MTPLTPAMLANLRAFVAREWPAFVAAQGIPPGLFCPVELIPRGWPRSDHGPQWMMASARSDYAANRDRALESLARRIEDDGYDVERDVGMVRLAVVGLADSEARTPGTDAYYAREASLSAEREARDARPLRADEERTMARLKAALDRARNEEY